MILHGDMPNLHQTNQQHKNCRGHDFEAVSEPKPTDDERVCMLPALWKLWQLQCNPGATTSLLATEESLQVQATNTVPPNSEELAVPQWLMNRHVAFFGLMTNTFAHDSERPLQRLR